MSEIFADLKVTHLSTSAHVGGAARAAARLHLGLRSIGVDSAMLVADSGSKLPEVAEFRPGSNVFTRLGRRVRRERIAADHRRITPPARAGREPFSDDRTQFGPEPFRGLAGRDVINLHWIRGFIHTGALVAHVARPLVFTLHDMNPFTGGCHYSEGCTRYRDRCGACPQIGSGAERDLSRAILRRRERTYARAAENGWHVVAPSRWIAAEARKSHLLRSAPIEVIPYGVDTGVFRPGEATVIRRRLGIPELARVVLFIADNLENPRKGFAQLAEGLNAVCPRGDVWLVSVGSEEPDLRRPFPHLHLGRIDDDATLANIYSAADLFVLPSRQDNLPNTALEAMACGTPLVAFASGGIPDLVRPGVSGALVPPGDPRKLATAIRGLLDGDEQRKSLGRNCRAIALREYTLELQATRYAALYERLATRSRVNNG